MRDIDRNAPVIIDDMVYINAPSEKVWDVLTDINNWAKWMDNVSYCQLNGELKEQTTFDWKASGTKIRSVIHTVDPQRFIGWTGKTMGLKAVHNWSFTWENGQTKVFVEESMDGWGARILKNILRKSLLKDMEKSLQLLKTTCEN